MPILGPTTPYDTADYILNIARAIVNDAGISIAGNILSDSQPYTFVLLNLAWRDLQDALMDNGVETFPQEVILASVTPVQTLDPGVQVYINYSNYYDGVNLNASPILPQDCIIPIRLWERVSGTNQQFVAMYPVSDGLQSRPKTTWLREWEWRDDALYMVGAQQTIDIRFRYNRYLPDIAAGDSPVPILRCAQALARYTAAEFASSRGSALTAGLYQQAQQEVDRMIGRTNRRKQRAQHRRQPYSRRSHVGWGWF